MDEFGSNETKAELTSGITWRNRQSLPYSHIPLEKKRQTVRFVSTSGLSPGPSLERLGTPMPMIRLPGGKRGRGRPCCKELTRGFTCGSESTGRLWGCGELRDVSASQIVAWKLTWRECRQDER